MMKHQNAPLPSADVGFSGAIQSRTRWDDNISWFSIPDKMVISVRFFGPVFVYRSHWFKTKSGKKFPAPCAAYNLQTQLFDQGKCPYEDDFHTPSLIEEAKKSNPYFDELNDPIIKEFKDAKASIIGLGHLIVRAPASLSLGKPWQSIRLNPSLLFSLLKLKSMNRVTIGGKIYEADIADPYWGKDIHLKYDPSERNPNARYTISLGEHTPLTDVEQSYLNELYQWKDLIEFPSYEDAKQQLTVNNYYNMLKQLKGEVSEVPSRGSQMESYLPPVPKSPYTTDVAVPQQSALPNRPQQNYSYPQMPQAQAPAPQQAQVPMPQTKPMPQAPRPQMHTQMQQQQAPMPHMPTGELVEVEDIEASPLPSYVPPPLEDDFEIPFGEPRDSVFNELPDIEVKKPQPKKSQKTYTVKGKPSGVSAEEFQKIISDFGSTLARAKPMKESEDTELDGFYVLSCYGNYCGDMHCVKCPLRNYCLHA